MSAEIRHGTVKWFDFGKHYGFVTLPGEDKDAMLHLSTLQELKLTECPKGSEVQVEIETTKRGLSVRRIHAFAPPADTMNGECYERATVKWFDHNKGYGFVTRGEGTPDVFIHAVIVKASSIVELRPDQEVMVVIKEGTHGPKVIHIKAA